MEIRNIVMVGIFELSDIIIVIEFNLEKEILIKLKSLVEK